MGGGNATHGEESESMRIHANPCDNVGIQKNQSEPMGCYGYPVVAMDCTCRHSIKSENHSQPRSTSMGINGIHWGRWECSLLAWRN